jgi:phosphatidylcholine synthase
MVIAAAPPPDDTVLAGAAVPSGGQRLAAGAVHLYTASGVVLALLIVQAAQQGEVVRALWLGLAALVVDGTDGMLARRLQVKQRLPWFDGALLDNITDYLTYVFAPVLLLHSDGRLPDGQLGTVVAAVPLLASGYQFCRVDAKTADHVFLGFPSYWNVVAFYAVVLDLPTGAVTAVLLACAALVPLPVGYLYPSRSGVLRRTSLVLTAVWLATYAVLLLQVPDPHPLAVALSLGYVGYYVAVSAYLTVARSLPSRRRTSRRRTSRRR